MNFLESVSCDICGCTETTEVVSQKDLAFLKNNDIYHVVECLKCRLRFTNPRPVREEMGQFYFDEYYDLSTQNLQDQKDQNLARKCGQKIKTMLKESFYSYPGQSKTKENVFFSKLKRTILRIVQLWLKISGREKGIIPFVGNGRVLDVGCGNGTILKGLKSEGWETFGVELNQKAAEYATQTLGLKVFSGTLSEAKFPDSFFDVILFNHTLEHMHSPNEILREANRILKRGGLVIISLPNSESIEAKLFKSFWFPWELPRHLYHFSAKTLSKVLKLNKFEIKRVVGEVGGGTFIQSLEYVYRFKFKKPLSAIKVIKMLVRPMLFILGHCAVSGIITVYAIKNGHSR